MWCFRFPEPLFLLSLFSWMSRAPLNDTPIAREAPDECYQMTSMTTEEAPPPADAPAQKPVGFWGLVVTVVNILVGAGILGVPSTFHTTGIISSIIVMIIIVVINHCAGIITLTLQDATQSDGMDETAGRTIGPKGRVALSIMILIFNTSSLLAYLIIGTDFILSWCSAAGYPLTGRWPRAGVVFCYALIIPIALAIPRSLKGLSYVSGFACCCMITYLIVMAVELGLYEHESKLAPNPKIITMNLQVFASLAVYSLAFAIPVCICPVMRDSNPEVKFRNRAVATALAIALTIAVTPSICAYLIFGPDCKGNIIDSFPDGDRIIVALRIAFFILISFSYPAVHPAVSCSWSSLIFGVNQAIDLVGWRRAAVLAISNAIPLVVAMFLPDVKPALEIGGSIGGCLGNFAMPGIMWIVVSEDKWYTCKNLLVIAMIVFGVVSAGISGWYAVNDAIEAFKKT